VWAFIVAFLDESVADFTSEHFLIILGFFAKVFDFSVFGTEDGQNWAEIESFEGKFSLNRMFERLLEVIGCVQNTPIIDIGDIDV
jgi:hypothetical protein